MQASVTPVLQDIVTLIDRIDSQLAGLDETAFRASADIQDATAYRLQHIGEAVKRLPDSFKVAHPDIPWARIVGMRNLLAHQYFAFDPALAWQTVQQSLSILRAQCMIVLTNGGEADVAPE